MTLPFGILDFGVLMLCSYQVEDWENKGPRNLFTVGALLCLAAGFVHAVFPSVGI